MDPLCNLADLPEGTTLEVRRQQPLMLVHRNGQVQAYINRCPHLGLTLNFQPNVFLDIDRQYIQCANHGALFEIDSGLCIHGPCHGQHLEPVAIDVRDGKVWLLASTEHV
jgi:nitrite reductase/ring-hydroxylating ferredoxin subunit